MRRLLVPLDGSDLAAKALPLARRIAAAAGGQIVLARAVPYASARDATDEALQRGLLRWMKSDLDRLAARQAGDGVDCWARVCRGEPADALVELAELIDADAIVMTSHGRTGISRWLFGSVAESVLRRSLRPVLVVPAVDPPARAAAPTARRVLVPLDGSPAGEAVLDPAVGLARALDARVLLLRVVDPGEPPAAARGYLGQIAERLRGRVAGSELRVEAGDPALRIEGVAAEVAPIAIAMATHGRGGLDRVLLGSVSSDVLHRTRLPALLVRPAAGGRSGEAVPVSASAAGDEPIGSPEVFGAAPVGLGGWP
jgi:nucleotide-binding universal stress UspA family protein